jgi:hypothetical protein
MYGPHTLYETQTKKEVSMSPATVVFFQSQAMLAWGTVEFRANFTNSSRELLVAAVQQAFQARFPFLARQSAKEGIYLWLLLKGKSFGKSCTVEVYSTGLCIAKNLPDWDGKIDFPALTPESGMEAS